MFCPKCATQNNEGAKFCRSCGSDISLVPQAMTGQIQVISPDEIDDGREWRRSHRRHKNPTIEGGITRAFMGLGFIAVALALSYSRTGTGWWFWMLIPGFMMLGGGVSEFIRWRYTRNELAAQSKPAQTFISTGQSAGQLPPRNTSELVAPPPSVTEGTTRHLGAEGPTKVFAQSERPK